MLSCACASSHGCSFDFQFHAGFTHTCQSHDLSFRFARSRYVLPIYRRPLVGIGREAALASVEVSPGTNFVEFCWQNRGHDCNFQHGTIDGIIGSWLTTAAPAVPEAETRAADKHRQIQYVLEFVEDGRETIYLLNSPIC